MNGGNSRRCFTLIELLVVIAIVAILFAMLLPMHGGHGGSLMIQCLSNQKQLALSAFMYADDSKKGFPNLDNLPGNDGPVTLTLITNYLNRRTNLFMCPFVVRQREADRPWYREKFIPELNAAFFRSNGNDYAYYDGLMASSPTNAILADRLAWTNRLAAGKAPGDHVGGRINVAFADGHVEMLRSNQVVGADYTPAWSSVQDPIRRR